MATLTINYTNWTAITATAVTTSLAADEWAETTIVDNTTNKYVDAMVGGKFVVGAAHANGDTIDVYVYGNYDTATAGDLTGSIGGLDGTDSEETEGTDFVEENMILLTSVFVDAASDTQHWGPIGVAQAFGGHLPQKWGLLIHNNGSGAMGSGSDVGYVGIKYDSA